MKNTKFLILFMIGGTVSSVAALTSFETIAGVIFLLFVTLSIPFVVSGMRDEKKGLALDDELSHRIMEKAGARAFVVSLFMWMLIMRLTSNSTMDREIPLGFGIISMGLIFLGFWLYHSKRGVGHENQT